MVVPSIAHSARRAGHPLLRVGRSQVSLTLRHAGLRRARSQSIADRYLPNCTLNPRDDEQVNSFRNLDLAPDGKRSLALMPAAKSKESQEAQNHIVFLEDVLDELARITAIVHHLFDLK